MHGMGTVSVAFLVSLTYFYAFILFKAIVDLSNFSRHDLSYFEARYSIFGYMNSVTRKF